MAEALVTLFNRLGEIAHAEAQLQLGIGNDIKFIKDEFSTMKAFLKDAESRSFKDDKVVGEWVLQVRDESFKIERVLEEFLHRMELLRYSRISTRSTCLNLKFSTLYVSSFFKQMYLRHDFHAQIETIRKEVNDISARRYHFGLRAEGHSHPMLEQNSTEDYSSSAASIEDVDVVGIEAHVQELEKKMLEVKAKEKHRRTVISIVGMGGLGKTTLVKLVYKRVQKQFQCYAWISVSRSVRVKTILRCMLEEFYKSRQENVPDGVETMSEATLERMILEYLQGQSYALVLDDIWDIAAWEGVKHALPINSHGKIIFTTRSEIVAQPLNEVCDVYMLKPLPPNFARNLFCSKAFRYSSLQGKCPKYLNELVDAMVKKCSGLPLALVVLGGLISKKGENTIAWNNVIENLNWELNQNQDLQMLNRVLLTSYSYLPAYLKNCFLYCGMFPEDFEIEKDYLIRLWVAEGFTEEHPRKTAEEVGNGYLVELILRSMLQGVYHERSGELRACKVHDLMREMAIHLVEKEHFGVVLDAKTRMQFRGGARHHRIAIHKHGDIGNEDEELNIVPTDIGELKLRSFLMFAIPNDISSLPLRSTLRDQKFLRVLELEYAKIGNLLGSILGSLIHLRYLGLRGTDITVLPSSVGKLRNLQTIDVRDTKLTRLPSEITHVEHLKHLLCSNFLQMPTGTKKLCQLQTLENVRFDAVNGLTLELRSLTQLKRLVIREVRGGDYCREVCNCVRTLTQLREFEIHWSGGNEKLQLRTLSPPPPHLELLVVNGSMERLPRWIRSLMFLHRVGLFNNSLTEDPFPILGQLPNLVTLHLFNAFTGKIMCLGGKPESAAASEEAFPNLKALYIMRMNELEELGTVEDGTMKNLQCLTIGGCPNLKMLPIGIQKLTKLKELFFTLLPDDFVRRHSKGGVGHWMIQHIPEITCVVMLNGRTYVRSLVG